MSNWALRTDPFPEGDNLAIPDTPIDISIQYSSRVKGAARHFGFFPFFAKKPWPVVQEYIKHYTASGELVCDPFAGSGVTPVEALVLGRRAVAGDINPVARFITQMTAVAPVDLTRLNTAYDRVRLTAQKSIEQLDEMNDDEIQNLLTTLDYPRVPIPPTVRRAGREIVADLHTPRQLAGLTLLRDAINQIEEQLYRDLMKVVLAKTVRYANITYNLSYDKGRRRAPFRGDAGFLRRFSYSPASSKLFYEHQVWPVVEHVFSSVYKAKEETNGLIGSRYIANFRLTEVPASRIHEITGEGRVDYCFTDPPYSNDIYFVDLSTLWAAWLDLEISTETKKAELIQGGTQQKTREQFMSEFADSMESIARALKPDRWFTLVYKHKDLSLWQEIVAACEDSGLHYVNAVWQDVNIKSAGQHEHPNINPQGDMYLNFRKMPPKKFEQIYGKAQILELPTRTNYVEREIERLIVAYLGADIEVITAGVIQQVLDSRAFQNYRDNPQGVTEDIQKVLEGTKFTRWQPEEGKSLWIMASNASLEPTLEAIDRARYHIFDYLRKVGRASEADVRQHLLTLLSREHDLEPILPDVKSLLRSIAREVNSHIWQFDPKRVIGYKQLRLLFKPSLADKIRESIERHQEHYNRKSLDVNPEGFALLHDILEEVNKNNPQFEKLYSRLQEVLQTILWRLESDFEPQIERVVASGDWVRYGIDLRNLPYDDVNIQIVLSASDRPFSLYQQIASIVFTDLRDEDIFVQFGLLTFQEWQHAESLSFDEDRERVLGITLMDRS